MGRGRQGAGSSSHVGRRQESWSRVQMGPFLTLSLGSLWALRACWVAPARWRLTSPSLPDLGLPSSWAPCIRRAASLKASTRS